MFFRHHNRLTVLWSWPWKTGIKCICVRKTAPFATGLLSRRKLVASDSLFYLHLCSDERESCTFHNTRKESATLKKTRPEVGSEHNNCTRHGGWGQFTWWPLPISSVAPFIMKMYWHLSECHYGIIYRLFHSSHRNNSENFKCVRKNIIMIPSRPFFSLPFLSAYFAMRPTRAFSFLWIDFEGSLNRLFVASHKFCNWMRNCTFIMQISSFG